MAGAEQILRDLSERYPNSSLVLMPLADLEFDMKRYEQALNYYQRAGAGWYTDAELHLAIAKSYQGMGRGRAALDQCKLAEAMSPRDWKVQFSCAKIREAVADK